MDGPNGGDRTGIRRRACRHGRHPITGCEKVLSHAAEGGAFSSVRRAFAFGFGAGPTNGGSGNSLILQDENNPSPRASPYPLPSERAMINCVGRGLLSTDISLSDHNIQTPGQD